MTFLKKLGSIILKATEIVTGFAPIASAAFPGVAGTVTTVSADLAQIATIITNVEAVGQVLSTPGAQKLAGATPLVAQVILQSSVLVGHEIADPALFQKGAGEIAGGMADILNSLKDKVDSTNKA